jgi:hypothetical protein
MFLAVKWIVTLREGHWLVYVTMSIIIIVFHHYHHHLLLLSLSPSSVSSSSLNIIIKPAKVYHYANNACDAVKRFFKNGPLPKNGNVMYANSM